MGKVDGLVNMSGKRVWIYLVDYKEFLKILNEKEI